MKKSNSFLSSTTLTVKSLLGPAASALNGYREIVNIKVAEHIQQPKTIKDTLEHRDAVNMTGANYLIMAAQSVDIAWNLLSTNAWSLMNATQRTMLMATIVLGGVSAIYPAIEFGNPNRVFYSEISAGGGILSLSAAQAMSGFFALKANNIVADEETAFIHPSKGLVI